MFEPGENQADKLGENHVAGRPSFCCYNAQKEEFFKKNYFFALFFFFRTLFCYYLNKKMQHSTQTIFMLAIMADQISKKYFYIFDIF